MNAAMASGARAAVGDGIAQALHTTLPANAESPAR